MDLGIREVYSVSRILLLCGLAAAVTVLHAQAPEPVDLERRAYVRRISAGASLTVPVFNLIKPGSADFSRATPPLIATRDSTSKYHWGGGGVMLQIAILEKLAVNMNAFYRKAEYTYTEIDVAGVDNPNTPLDDRIITTIDGWTRIRYLDIPVLARYYNKGRHRKGNRWFFEAGPNTRTVRKVLTTLTTTDMALNVSKATSPLPPYKRTALGVTAGFGGQFIDPVGLRVIPEVRYTRWFGLNFDVPATHSRRDQIEFVFSLAF
jgi:hypothetical protein